MPEREVRLDVETMNLVTEALSKEILKYEAESPEAVALELFLQQLLDW